MKVDARPLPFPPGFLWGTATAPTQVEGFTTNEWTDVRTVDLKSSAITCDHYHRYREDIDLMTRIGANAYRFGIEWSRMQTEPYGELVAKEVDHYLDVLQCLKDQHIKPMIVLHHFSNPPWISQQGGWVNPKTVDVFVDYVARLLPYVAPFDPIWNTFNEPDTYASCTYLVGEFPPFNRGRFMAYRKVIRNMAEAHRRLFRLFHDHGGTEKPQVGFSKNYTFFVPHRRARLLDALLARVADHLFNRFVLREFLENPCGPCSDYVGLNYYGKIRVHHLKPMAPVKGMTTQSLMDMGIVCDDMLERYPEGLFAILKDLSKAYALPIHITETGSATTDEEFRTTYLVRYLQQAHRAIQEGVDVRGLFYWSLMDNFEWMFGLTKKFGLIDVDFADPALPRRIKSTGDVFRRIATENAVGGDLACKYAGAGEFIQSKTGGLE
jgi:beta-glucosidase